VKKSALNVTKYIKGMTRVRRITVVLVLRVIIGQKGKNLRELKRVCALNAK